jgi:hypothetical protein
VGENLIRYVRMELLGYLRIEGVNLGSLMFLKGVKCAKLTCLVVSGVGIKSIEGLKSENFPCLNKIYLRGNPELGLDEDVCKELEQVEYLRMEVGAYMKGMDMGSPLSKLRDLTFTRGWGWKCGFLNSSKRSWRIGDGNDG